MSPWLLLLLLGSQWVVAPPKSCGCFWETSTTC